MVELNLNQAVKGENVQDALFLKEVLNMNIVQLACICFSIYGSKLNFSDSYWKISSVKHVLY